MTLKNKIFNKINKYIFEIIILYCLTYNFIGIFISLADKQIFSFMNFIASFLILSIVFINFKKK
jgi:hypothetical protein